MLRLKQALLDCGIPQKTVCEATGFGKTQVSLTLSSGKLPADEERFKDGVAALASSSQLGVWLEDHNMNVMRLFETVGDRPRLDDEIYANVGLAVVTNQISSTDLTSMAKLSIFLLETLRAQPLGLDELATIEMEATQILAGGGV